MPGIGTAESVVDALPTDLYIGGAWRHGSYNARIEVEDPATGKVVSTIAEASAADCLDALAAAGEAQNTWAAQPPTVRADLLRAAYDRVLALRDEFATIITLEMGKPLPEARAEVDYAAGFLRWFSEEAVRIDGRYAPAPGGDSRMLVMRRPVGPALLITPWNFPLAMGARKVAPALAAGCTTVIKPAKQTPLATLKLVQVLDEVGVPPGVVNVVTPSSAGRTMPALLNDPRLRKLSFTGSTEVGQRLVAQSAHQLLRVSMELGGNAPFLVFADADVDAAVEGALLAKMRNGGEACTAANRFRIAAPILDEFTEKFAKRIAQLTVGSGLEPGTDVGPLIDDAQRDKVAHFVDDAVNRGARVVTGGQRIDGPGYFYQPTVLTDVPEDAALLHDEVFGPVAAITRFTDDDEAITWANDTPYGLVAYVYTKDLARAFQICESLEVGMVGLNRGLVSNPAAPFGGVKHSGFGREGGKEGIDDYTTTRYVAVATS